MKKPDYCPEWFHIGLYDNLKGFSRDELCFSLWARVMHYKRVLDKENWSENREAFRTYAIEWLAELATNGLQVQPGYKDSQAKENYNPLAVNEDIIQELNWRDIARIYTESYVEIPEMWQFFQSTRAILDECVDKKELGANAHTEWIGVGDIMPEDKYKEDIENIDNFFDLTVASKLNYAEMFSIDFSQSDEILKMAFEQKLKEVRAREEKQTRVKRFSDAEIARIIEYRVFAYIDLYVYGVMIDRKFTDVEMAAMIYPPTNNTPLNFDAVDRIARTVRPRAIELLERTNPRLLL